MPTCSSPLTSKARWWPRWGSTIANACSRWSRGAYFVRGRASDHLLEGLVELGPRQRLSLSESRLSRVEYARLARKGGSDRARAHGPWLGYQVRSPIWSGATLCQGLRAGYAVDLAQLS